MSKLNELAGLAATRYAGLSGDKQAALDPATLFGFIEIIRDTVSSLMKCKATPAEAVKAAKNPGPFQRLALRRVTKDNLGDDFKKHGKDVIDAVLEVGEGLSEADFAKLYKEV